MNEGTTMQFMITTPQNPEMEGEIFGVKIREGQGILSAETISKQIKRTVPEIARAIRQEFTGYTLTPMDEEAQAVLAEPVLRQAQDGPKHKPGAR
jgi:hypothetical protein